MTDDIMQATGWVLDVAQVPIGTQLLGDHAATSTVLVVADAEPFAEQGGTVWVAGSLLAYVSADLDADTVTLAAPIGFAALDGDDVYLFDDISGGIAAEFVANVEFSNDADGDDDSAPALIAHGLGDRIPSGVRDGRGENVILQRNTTGSTWTIIDVVGSELILDGSYIAPDTLPATANASDGLVPASSPTPTVGAGLGIAVLSWTQVANTDPVTYDAYVNATAPVPMDTAHRLGSVTDSSVMTLQVAKGNWHVVLQARDEDGPAPTPSADVAFTIVEDEDSLAIRLANNEQTVADGAALIAAKPRVVFATTQPVPVGTEKVIWYDTANGYAASYFNGTTWAPYVLGTGAIGASAITALQLAAGAVTAPKIGALAVDVTKLADGSVSAVKIVDGAVSTAKLVDGSILSAKMADGAVLTAKLAAGAVDATKLLDGAVSAVKIAAGAVDQTKLLDGAVVAAKIAASAVDASKILDGAVQTAKIAAGAVSAANVGFTIGGGNLLPNSSFDNAAGFIGNASAGNSVASTTDFAYRGTKSIVLTTIDGTSASFASWSSASMASQRLRPNTTYTFSAWVLKPTGTSAGTFYRLRVGGIANPTNSGNVSLPVGVWTRLTLTFTTGPTDSAYTVYVYQITPFVAGDRFYIGAIQLEEGDIGTAYAPKPDEILPSTITATEIADNAITTPKLITNAVVAGKIAADAVTANEIAANSINASELSANAVTAGKIAALTIVAGDIAADTITAGQIAANGITASELTALSVVAGKIAALAVTATELAAGSVVAGKIQAGAIVAADIAATTITAAKIAGQTITATQVAADTITASQIAADAITATELSANAVIAGKIAADAVTANTIATGAVIAGKIAAQAVGANEIAANSIVAGNIAAGAITTDKLTVASLGTDLVRDGGFEDATSWTLAGGAARVAGSSHSGSVGLALVTNGGIQAQQQPFPIAAGDVVAVSAWARSTASPNALYLRLSWRNAAGGEISIFDVVGNTNVPAAWTRYTGNATAPAGTVNAVFQLYNTTGTCDVDDISVRPVVVAAQIADGAIIAGKIKAGAVTAGTLDADVVTSANIVGQTITGTDIAGQTITGTLIAGTTITGTNIAGTTITGSNIAGQTITALQIAGQTITATQIASQTITGTQIAGQTITGTHISGTAIDGKTITGATLQTAASPGERIVVRNDGSGGIIEAFAGLSGETASTIDPAAISSRPSITIKSGTAATYTGTTNLQIYSGVPGNVNAPSVFQVTTDAFNVVGSSVSKTTITHQTIQLLHQYAGGSIQIGSGTNNTVLVQGATKIDLSTPLLYLGNGGAYFNSGGALDMGAHTIQNIFNLTATGAATLSGGLTVTGGSTLNGATVVNNIAGTGTTAVYAQADGRLQRGSSSMRYKENARPLREDTALKLLDLTPIVWQYRDRAAHGDRLYAGFGAEHVKKAGLHLYLDYAKTKAGKRGRVENVRKEDLVAPMLVLIQRHEKTIASQAERLTRLEADVAALLAR